MYNVKLFTHADGRSPNFYCLHENPRTGKHEPFSCRTSSATEARIFATRKLPQIKKREYERMSGTHVYHGIRNLKPDQESTT